MSDHSTIVDRLSDLRRRITDADHAYYVLDDPYLSDAEWDALMRELRALEAEHPELADRVTAVIQAIAERAEYLRTRPLPDEPPPAAAERNYLELWAQDQKRREDSCCAGVEALESA